MGLIDDLAIFISSECKTKSNTLQSTWKAHWEKISEDQNVTDTLVKEIDDIRRDHCTTNLTLTPILNPSFQKYLHRFPS